MYVHVELQYRSSEADCVTHKESIEMCGSPQQETAFQRTGYFRKGG